MTATNYSHITLVYTDNSTYTIRNASSSFDTFAPFEFDTLRIFTLAKKITATVKTHKTFIIWTKELKAMQVSDMVRTPNKNKLVKKTLHLNPAMNVNIKEVEKLLLS